MEPKKVTLLYLMVSMGRARVIFNTLIANADIAAW